MALVEQAKWCDKFVFSKVMCSTTRSGINLAHWPAVAVTSPVWTAPGQGLSTHSYLCLATHSLGGMRVLLGRETSSMAPAGFWSMVTAPCPSILPACVWPQLWVGTGLALQTHVLWSLGSSLLGGCLPLFLLECVPCSGGYHDRDAAPGLLPLTGYDVS